MPSKGLRRTSLSTDTKFDTSDTAREPLKPLLGIAVVMPSPFFSVVRFVVILC